MLHDVVPMVEIRSEIELLWAVKSLGQSRSAWRCLRRKRDGSRQETVTAELRSHGTMCRKELVSNTGTRLS